MVWAGPPSCQLPPTGPEIGKGVTGDALTVLTYCGQRLAHLTRFHFLLLSGGVVVTGSRAIGQTHPMQSAAVSQIYRKPAIGVLFLFSGLWVAG